MRIFSKHVFLVLALLLVSGSAGAVSGVNPSGVNVRHSGPTTVFLTFQNLNPGQVAVEAFWCTDVTTTAVSSINPCISGTIIGRLPLRHDLSTSSGTGTVSNFTDIMTIPTSVARRAYQSIANGSSADPRFFYVRHFRDTNGGVDQFVTVTCRMAGGGARVPLALLDVRVNFLVEGERKPVLGIASGEIPPAFGADIHYNGSGRLKGRWEVMMPGDPEPEARDLLTEATLPIEDRGLQRRYTLVSRFDIFLPPTGRVFLPGPDAQLLPHASEGAYKVLLRVEATDDKEGNSNAVAGVVNSGGVAGFPMPVLRYYVGSVDAGQLASAAKSGGVSLMLPQAQARVASGADMSFSWVDVAGADLYRLEVVDGRETVLTAIVQAGVGSYAPPPWLKDHGGTPLRWRVSALRRDGSVQAFSDWRAFEITP